MPDDILTFILAHWVHILDVYGMDMAVSNHILRGRFLSVLKGVQRLVWVGRGHEVMYDDDDDDDLNSGEYGYGYGDEPSYFMYITKQKSKLPYNLIHWVYVRDIPQKLRVCVCVTDDDMAMVNMYVHNHNTYLVHIHHMRIIIRTSYTPTSCVYDGLVQVCMVFAHASISVDVYDVNMEVFWSLNNIHTLLLSCSTRLEWIYFRHIHTHAHVTPHTHTHAYTNTLTHTPLIPLDYNYDIFHNNRNSNLVILHEFFRIYGSYIRGLGKITIPSQLDYILGHTPR